jgi:hypothetical protein
MNDGLGIRWDGATMTYLRHYLGIYLLQIKKSMKDISQDSWYIRPRLDPGTSRVQVTSTRIGQEISLPFTFFGCLHFHLYEE